MESVTCLSSCSVVLRYLVSGAGAIHGKFPLRLNFVRVCINNTGKYKSIFRTTHYAVLHNKRSQSPSLEQI